MRKILDYESVFWEKGFLVSGVDEAGRGALAGPLVVAAVLLPIYFSNCLIQDSKLLSPKQREKVFKIIKRNALAWKIVIVNSACIEKNNPLEATKMAMAKAILELKKLFSFELCLVDGREEIFLSKVKTFSLIAGDRKSINIAAASILAKVTRDKIMQKMDFFFPVYGWYSNKGYFDKKHFLALLDFGFSSLHRKNYEPVKSIISKIDLLKLKKKYNYLFV